MKKKKLFVLLPLVALLLSSCSYSIIPWDAPEEDDEALGEYTPSESENSGSSGDTGSGSGGDDDNPGGDEQNPDEGGGEYTPTTSETYEVKIVNTDSTLTVGEADLPIYVKLITYTYIDNELTGTNEVDGDINSVTLTSSAPGVASIVEGELKVHAEAEGSANITATWTEKNVTSEDFTVSVFPKEVETRTEYKVEITNATDLASIQTGDDALVEVTLTTYTYIDDVLDEQATTTRVATSSDASDITLISGSEDILSTTTGSLSVHAVAAGSTTLKATWGSYGTSEEISVVVSAAPDTGEGEEEGEEDIYTYGVEITNKADLANIVTGYEHQDDTYKLEISLTIYKNEVVENTISASNSSDCGIEISVGDSSVLTVNTDLSLNILATEGASTTITVSWPDHYSDAENLTLASDSVEVSITYNERPAVLITSIGFDQDTYTLYVGGNDDSEPKSVTYSVSYEPTEVDDNTYTVSLAADSNGIVTLDSENQTLTAVGEGTTSMSVSSNDGGASGSATIEVKQGKTNLLGISLSNTTYSLSYDGSFTLGVSSDSFTPDVGVILNPTDADDPSITVSETSTNYLDITATDGHYVVSVNEATKETLKDSSLSATISVASSAYAEVEPASLTVSMTQMGAETAHPVTGLTLSGEGLTEDTGDGYSYTITYDGSLTIGGESPDVTVSVSPDDAYLTGWSAKVDSSAGDSSIISLTGDSTNGYTVSVLNGTSLKEDTSAKVIITTDGNGADGSPLSTTLTINITHQASYPVSLSVSGFETSILLETNKTTTISVSSTVYDQRGDELTGYGVSASVANDDSTDVSVSDAANGTFTISSGSVEGTATISFYLTDYVSVIASETIAVTVRDLTHPIETVTYTGGDQTLEVEQTEEGITYGSFTVTDEMVSFSNSTSDVSESDVSAGFTLTADNDNVTIDEDTHTITAAKYSKDEDLTSTITITSVANTDASTTFTITIKDITDYSVKSLSLVTEEGNDLDSVTINVDYDNGSDNNTLESLGIYVSIKPDYATEQDYTVTITDGSGVTYSDGIISAAASKENYTATLTVTSTSNESAYDSLTINVVTSYVKADIITIDSNLPSTITDGDVIDLDSYVTISSSSGYTPTIGSYTVNSSNEAISVSGHTLTAVAATSDTITITISSEDASTTIEFSGVEAKAVFESYTLTITLYKSDGTIFPTATGDYGVYLVDESGSSGWITDGLMTNNGDGSYSYIFDTLPSVGTHEMHLFAGNEDGISWSHDLGYFTWTISGDETGNVVKDDISITLDSEYQEWYGDNGIFKPLGNDVEFYIVIFDGSDTSKSASYNSAFTSATAINSELSCFNGNDWGNCSTAMTAYNQTYLYNTTPGEAAAGSEGWFNFSGGDGGVNAGTLTIPEVDSGNVAVYIAISTSENWNDWYNAWSPSWPSIGGWYTSYSSVSACINALATDVVWP